MTLPPAYEAAVAEAVEELGRAVARHRPINSPHEGWAVIREELDELWERVRADIGCDGAARREAAQVAAMALRYMAELTAGRGRG